MKFRRMRKADGGLIPIKPETKINNNDKALRHFSTIKTDFDNE